MKLSRSLCVCALALLALLPPACKKQEAEPTAKPPTAEAASPPDHASASDAPEQAETDVDEMQDEGDKLPEWEPEAPGYEPQVPKTLAPSPHPIFDHWLQVLTAQSTPELLCHVKEGEPLSEDDQADLDETRDTILIAMEAAMELYSARMAVIEGALKHPDLAYEEDTTAHVLETCRAWVAEGFRRDLEALSFCESWLDAGCVRPSLRPGRQELLMRPELESLRFAKALSVGGTYTIGVNMCAVNSEWEARQDLLLRQYLSRYCVSDKMDELNRRDPFTGMCWVPENNGCLSAEDQAYLAEMQQIIRDEHKAWERYLSAMSTLVTPCRGYRGSGAGIMATDYECHLLDSRERYLYLLTLGYLGLIQHDGLVVDSTAELQPLHTVHAFGELFMTEATLFRHPELEGKPWCIRFRRQGAGFIFVPDGKVLQAYLAANPNGGEVMVRGYQSIEPIGRPYKRRTRKDCDYDERKLLDPPADAMKLRQVFRMTSCLPLDQYEYKDGAQDDDTDAEEWEREAAAVTP